MQLTHTRLGDAQDLTDLEVAEALEVVEGEELDVALGEVGEALADQGGILRVPMATGCRPSRHLYQVLVDGRDEVIVRLNAQGVYPGVHYRDNTLYRMYAYADGTCPRARRASDDAYSPRFE